MKNFGKILTGVASIAAITAMASPAGAQTAPYGYGYGQPSGGTGVVGAIIGALGGGYGQYPQGNYGYGQVDQRTAVSQCAAAAEQRINASYRGQGYGYQNGYQNGYGQNAYGYSQGGGHVVGITSVERRNSGLRVRGLATSGAYAGQRYGNQSYGSQYGQYAGQYGANGAADLSFSCKVSFRGQVTDLNINRSQAGYTRGY